MVDFKKALERKRELRIDLNPSAADRWMTCTASPKFIRDNWDKVPPQDTAFSQEGTTAHELSAALLQDRKPRLKDKYHCPTEPDAEMRWHTWKYAEYVWSFIELGGKLSVEAKLPLFYAEGRNAIVDAAVSNPGHLHLFDFKYGKGVIVNPDRSYQVSIYAKCFMGKKPVLFPSFPITIHIYQPRSRDESPFHIWETTWGEIEDIAKVIQAQAKMILSEPDFTKIAFAPSEKACQFCPAKGFCTARSKELTKDIGPLTVIPPDNEDMHFMPVKAVSMKELAAILRHGAQITKWLEDAKAYALSFMSQGNTIPGFKLVTGRQGNRAWADEKRAAHVLLADSILREDEVYVKSVISPAQAEEKLGKAKFNAELSNLITRSPGKATIVPDGDPRESALLDASTEFTTLE